jgi:hypothetical protein
MVKLGFDQVKARIEEPQFFTYHWVLDVPQGLYQEVLQDYPGDIYTEEPCQEFVTRYLRSRGDNGIVGLVGLEVKGEMLVIDAAVRYSQKKCF